MNRNYKFFISLLVIFFLGVLLGSSLGLPLARANLLDSLWRRVTLPFQSPGTMVPPESLNDPRENPAPFYRPTENYEQAVIAAVKKISPAVVSITISKNVPVIEQCPANPFSNLPPEFRQFFGDEFFGFSEPCERGTELREVGGGSGFVISSSGLILTNKHVVNDKKASYTVFTNDGKKYDANVLARDPAQDLAVIKIEATGLPVVSLGDSDSLELGQTVVAIGNALGEFRNTVSVGVVSGLSRNVTASGGGSTETIQGVIQTDAAINPGNSGGPLLNLRGEVVGVNTAVVSGAQNIGFAIPVNQAKRDIESVKATGEIRVPFLGVRYVIVTPAVAQKQKLPVDYGALIRGSDDEPAIQPGSPAEKAGIQAEDIILEVNGKKIGENFSLADGVSRSAVGETVTLKINRRGSNIILTAVLAKRPE